MWLTWVIVIAAVVAMYIIIYRYEKRIDRLHSMIEENKATIEENQKKIQKNRSKLEEHHSFIERMWVTIPKEHTQKE